LVAGKVFTDLNDDDGDSFFQLPPKIYSKRLCDVQVFASYGCYTWFTSSSNWKKPAINILHFR